MTSPATATSPALDRPSVVRAPSSAAGLGREALVAGAVVVLAHLLLGPHQLYALGSRGDDAAYVALGESIATGRGYRSLWYVGQPVQVKFPPVMPTLFAVVYWLGGSAAVVPLLARLVNPFVCGATVAILWHVGRRYLGISRLTAAAFVLSPYLLDSVLQHFSLGVSEPYFMLGWAATLALFYRATDGPPRLGAAAACGLAAALSYLTRSVGIGLLPAVVLSLLVARAGTRAVLAAAAAGLAPVLAWKAVHAPMVAAGPLSPISDERSYLSWTMLDDWRELARLAAETAFENFVVYLRVFASYVSGNLVVGIVVVAALLTFAVGGAARVGRRHAALVLLPAAVAAVVLLFPWFDPRYLTVALPFVGVLIAYRTDLELAERAPRGRAILTALVVGVGVVVAVRQVSLRRQTAEALRRGTVPGTLIPGYEIARTSAYLNTVNPWIARHAAPDERILVTWPTGVYAATRRLTQNADPGETSWVRSVFAVPGRFVAQRILEDSITMVVTGNPRSGTTRDVNYLRLVCPGVLERLDGGAEGSQPAYYAVRRTADACLQPMATAP